MKKTAVDIDLLLSKGGTLLTPNKRLGRELERNFLKKRSASCPRPNILSYRQWIEQLFLRQLDDKPLLLNKTQALYLWQQIIEKTHPHFNSKKLALEAKKAWKLLRDWQITINDDRLALTPDSRAFQQWAQSYENTINARNSIDEESLTGWILKHHQIESDPREKIYAYGQFDLSPAEKKLFEQLNIEFITKTEQETTQKSRRVFKNQQTELNAAAEFAKAFREKHPDQTLAIIIPDLNTQFHAVEFAFRQAFDAEMLTQQTLPFNISFGQPLSNTMLVQTAFALFSLQPSNEAKKIGYLLRSPLIEGWEVEQSARAMLDLRLRERSFKLDLDHLIMLTENDCPIFASKLQTLKKPAPKILKPSEWRTYFIRRLAELGLGHDGLSSLNYQTFEAFKTALKTLSTLDHYAEHLSYHQAIRTLESICAAELFQAESFQDANIQVLGFLEAADQTFHTVWQTGLSDAHWPIKGQANALLPRTLQREQNMPGPQNQHSIAFYQSIFNNLVNQSEHFIASYASQEDGVHYEPAEAIIDFPEEATADTSKKSIKQALNTTSDYQAPTLMQEEIPSGGTQILKRQANCPFQAFAASRCHTEPPRRYEFGFTQSIKGLNTHAILETLWNELRTQKNLLNLDINARKTLIKKHVGQHMAQYIHAPTFYRELEESRLNKQLNRWFEIETSRPSFKVVATEKSQSISIGPLQLKTRIDRIDETDDGKTILIDYKSRHYSPQSWLGERPDEPQLPLYASSLNKPLAAICFAELNIKDYRFSGLADKKNRLPKIKTAEDLNTMIDTWKSVLSTLSGNFAKGIATVDPKAGETSCRQCGLQAFCRIHEQ